MNDVYIYVADTRTTMKSIECLERRAFGHLLLYDKMHVLFLHSIGGDFVRGAWCFSCRLCPFGYTGKIEAPDIHSK